MSKKRRVSPPPKAAAVRLEVPQTGPDNETETYKYVISDLKRVAILSAAILALLVALSFFIR